MSLGLPPHLAARAISRSSVHAMHAVGLTLLATAFLVAIVFQAARPEAVLWPAMIAIVPMAVLLWLHDRSRSLLFAVSFLAIGAVCTYWYVVTFSSQTAPIVASDAFSTALPKVALVMVGGPGVGLAVRLTWCTIGYVTAELAAGVGLLQTGHPLQFDVLTFAAFAAMAVVLVLSYLSRRAIGRTQPLLHRAVRDEQVASMRYRIEVRAAALIHDTVLSHLAAIAGSMSTELSQPLRAQIERDLEVLIGQEWLSDESAAVDENARLEWQRSGLFSAIREAGGLGLEVESTGDLSSVSRLDRETSVALGLAVKQCLVNVIRHAGTNRAEVVVYGSQDEVSVMVIDAGRGFSETETGRDRLGLRNSVRRRMEVVGGSVQVWSTPGHGTSIMIRVPAMPAGDPGGAAPRR